MCQNMSGLSTAEVEFRKKAGLSNESVDSSTKTVAQIIRSNVVTYYNLIFLIITILLIVVGSFRDLTFLPIIIANMLIGIIQELRSKKILDDLTILNTPKITVRRNGSDQEVLADELVQDDVITLSAGGQIPADALVLSGNITVNEALITGEADEIVKKEGDSLFSGSFVISGECTAKLEKVGKDSYISGLMLQATQTKEGEQSEMIRALNRLVQTVGVIILPIGAILFLQQYFFSGATMKDSVTGMVAAILGMIPEGLYLLASVAMVVSVMRLGKQKVLIHDMKCIETLARVNVLCVDKTGTITVPEMEVAQFILAKDQNLAAEEEKNKVAKTISDCVRALPCDNATMEALQQYFTEPLENSAEKIVPFSSATKYSGVVLAGKAYVVGAPEFVLRQDYAAVQGTIEVFLEKGYRVLVFAEYEGNLDGKELTEKCKSHCIYPAQQCDPGGGNGYVPLLFQAGSGSESDLRGQSGHGIGDRKESGNPPCGKTGGCSNVENSGCSAEGSKKIHGVRQGDTGAETSSGAGIKRAGKDRGNDRRRRERYSCVKRCRLQHCDGVRQ